MFRSDIGIVFCIWAMGLSVGATVILRVRGRIPISNKILSGLGS